MITGRSDKIVSSPVPRDRDEGAVRDKARKGRLIAKARGAALAEIGPRGAAEGERLADIEAGADPALSVMRRGVTGPLLDLALDWQRDVPRQAAWHHDFVMRANPILPNPA
jgi:hypothetical protein